jgi:RNA-directed DNA polymerase
MLLLKIVALIHSANLAKPGTLATTTAGVPQGGIISQILANMTLDGLEDYIHNKYWKSKTGCINRQHNNHKVNLIRYADDLIITADTQETAKDLKLMLSDFLRIRGLELSEEKTKITEVTAGFDFLGWNFRKYNNSLKVQPSAESIKAIKTKIGITIKMMSACPQEAVIGTLNPQNARLVRLHLLLRKKISILQHLKS